jgi:hypothetical protein
MTRIGARTKLGAVLLLVFSMAPAAGNIGSCGQEAAELDATKFLAAKAVIDCVRCTECALFTEQCRVACTAPSPAEAAFPQPCFPLVHDGEVCLDALSAASCDSYASYVADVDATIPTECDFCPLDADGRPERDEDEE